MGLIFVSPSLIPIIIVVAIGIAVISGNGHQETQSQPESSQMSVQIEVSAIQVETPGIAEEPEKQFAQSGTQEKLPNQSTFHTAQITQGVMATHFIDVGKG